MKYFITGGSGFIGAHLVNRLRSQGHTVRNYSLEDGGDILDNVTLRGTIDSLQPDVIYHLAAQSGVQASREHPMHSIDLNVMGTVNVLEAARRDGTVKAIIVASSNHVYGSHGRPTTEDAALKQLDTYSASKIAADVLSRMYGEEYGLPVAVLRHTNCYGPGDPHLDHIIPGTINSILKGGPVIIRGDGKTQKAYLYIDDVVDAYLAVEGWLLTDPPYPVSAFNASTVNESVRDVVDTIIGLWHKEVSVEVQGIPNNQAHEDLDWSKLKDLTGWSPQWTLIRGAQETMKAMRAEREVYAKA